MESEMETKATPTPMEASRLNESDPRSAQDVRRCRQVEDALYRRARGYKVLVKKTYKVKRVEYDPDTGKKVSEREELEVGLDEVHVPADVRVVAYYLNNRDPARWREHPKEEGEEDAVYEGAVAYPPMAALSEPSGEEGQA